MGARLGPYNLALVACYTAPTWGAETIKALTSPYGGLIDPVHAAAAVRLRAILNLPPEQLLDLVGPLQALRGLGAPYRTVTVGERVAPMPTDTGLSIVPEATFAEAERPFAVVVPGGERGAIQAMADPEVQGYLRRAAEGQGMRALLITRRSAGC